MKILLATSKAVPSGGGIASYNQELVRSLGGDNTFYLLTAADEHDVEGYEKTVSLFGIKINDYEFAKQLVKRINNECFDLIINSNSEFISIVAPFLTSPIVSIAHFVNGLLADCAGFNNQYNNSIIALSEYGKQYLEEKFHIKDNKVKVIYNFVHPKSINYSKKGQKPVVIVYPGGTSINKSVDVVMDAAYRLKRTTLAFKFYWLGGVLLPSSNFSILGIKRLTQMIRGDSRFVFTGKVPREVAENYISMANVFLLPSRGEGCPMTLLEAMRVGCIPIVSDARHGSKELIEKSQSGFILKQGDSKSIYNLIVDIILNHEQYSSFYDKTKDYSDHELNAKKWFEKMNAIINNAVAKQKSSICMDERAFEQSYHEFSKLKKADRRKIQFSSMINRIRMDWLYLRWHGWE